MNHKTTFGAILCFAALCFAMPAFAGQSDPPAQAPPARETVNPTEKPFAFETSAQESYLPIAYATQEFASLSGYKILTAPAPVYCQISTSHAVAFRASVDLRQMTTAPPRS